MNSSALLTLLLIALQDPATPEDQAKAALLKTEELVRAGRYADARVAYAKIAQDFEATPAGREAKLRSQPSAYLGWADVVRHGPSKNRIDVVLMGDGYEMEHLKAFDKLAGDIPPLFERQETLREYYPYFNFERAVLLSKEDGVDGFGREYDTALGGYTTGTFAGHVGIDHELVDKVLRKIPDSDGQAIVFVKTGVLGTGGGGVATIGGREVRTVIHEFGHSFGRLADEYQTQQSHVQGAVRDAPNVTGSADPEQAPWKHWLEAKHPSVGMYEGAAGRVKDAWRPTASGCVMEDAQEFCVVCREALVLRIYSIVDPIDSCEPAAQRQSSPDSITLSGEPVSFKVDVLKPATHPLEVSWYVLPAEKLPKSEGPSSHASAGTAGPAERTKRGSLPPITETPLQVSRNDPDGVHTLRLSAKDYAPGRYRVICRVKDTTRLRGDKWPWVLSDPDGLLESERAWWLLVPEKTGG